MKGNASICVGQIKREGNALVRVGTEGVVENLRDIIKFFVELKMHNFHYNLSLMGLKFLGKMNEVANRNKPTTVPKLRSCLIF